MNDRTNFRQQAQRCLRLADQSLDQMAAQRLRELAAEYQRKADEAESSATPPSGK
jgi:hypothetical protein